MGNVYEALSRSRMEEEEREFCNRYTEEDKEIEIARER